MVISAFCKASYINFHHVYLAWIKDLLIRRLKLSHQLSQPMTSWLFNRLVLWIPHWVEHHHDVHIYADHSPTTLLTCIQLSGIPLGNPMSERETLHPSLLSLSILSTILNLN